MFHFIFFSSRLANRNEAFLLIKMGSAPKSDIFYFIVYLIGLKVLPVDKEEDNDDHIQ